MIADGLSVYVPTLSDAQGGWIATRCGGIVGRDSGTWLRTGSHPAQTLHEDRCAQMLNSMLRRVHFCNLLKYGKRFWCSLFRDQLEPSALPHLDSSETSRTRRFSWDWLRLLNEPWSWDAVTGPILRPRLSLPSFDLSLSLSIRAFVTI